MSGDEARALYLAEKAKRADRTGPAIAEACVEFAAHEAARREHRKNPLGVKPKLVVPKTRAQYEDLRETHLDALTYQRLAQ